MKCNFKKAMRWIGAFTHKYRFQLSWIWVGVLICIFFSMATGCGGLPVIDIKTKHGNFSVISKEELEKREIAEERDRAREQLSRKQRELEVVRAAHVPVEKPTLKMVEKCGGWFWQTCKMVEVWE